MTSVRNAYRQVSEIVDDQETTISALRRELGELQKLAGSAVDGVRDEVSAIVRSGITSEEGLIALSAAGNPKPAAELGRLHSIRRRDHEDITRGLERTDPSEAEILKSRGDAALRLEAGVTAPLAEMMTRFTAMSWLRRKTVAISNPTPEELVQHLADTSGVTSGAGFWQRLRDPWSGSVAKAEKAYRKSFGRDLLLDARTWAASAKEGRRLGSEGTKLNQTADALVLENARLAKALGELPSESRLFDAALAVAVSSSLTADGIQALRKMSPSAVNPVILAELARADGLRRVAAGVERHIAAVLKFHDGLGTLAAKLRRGNRDNPSGTVRFDIAPVRVQWEKLKKGLVDQKAAVAALRAAEASVDRELRGRDAVTAVSASSSDDMMNTLANLYLFDMFSRNADALMLAPMVQGLDPSQLPAECRALLPAAMLDASGCLLPDHAAAGVSADFHVPAQFSADIPSADFHVDIPQIDIPAMDASSFTPAMDFSSPPSSD